MKTTNTKSGVSDLILACFILSIFLLLENKKENNREETSSQATSEMTLQTSHNNSGVMNKNYFNSYILK